MESSLIRFFVLGLALAGSVALPESAPAQRPAPRWEVPGFDFSPNGAWRVRAREVARARAAARSRLLSAPAGPQGIMPAGPYGPGGAWTGDYHVPVIGGRPRDVDTSSYKSATAIQARLFGTGGGQISLRTFYDQQSDGLMTVTGAVLAWLPLSRDTSYYTGKNNCGGGVVCSDTSAHLGDFIRELLDSADAAIDFELFDNDGPDGTPNSIDDDGYVDLVGLLHPQIGGECQGGSPGTQPPSGYRHIWSHRYFVAGWGGGNYVTNDVSASGGMVQVRDYFMTGAEGGGSSGCTPGELMQIGTFAHEFGHGLDLPDLYDVGGPTEGIGHWGLMGAGNFRFAPSPSFMTGWSRAELGWVTEVALTANGTLDLLPTELADTVYLVPTGRSGEYFLLENRQRLESDTGLHGPGLTIYHADSELIAQRRVFNTVNHGSIHGVALEEADGLRHLWCCNRGDGGDVYPGTSANRTFSGSTNPNNRRNDGAASGFRIDSIRQVIADGPVRFFIRFGGETTIEADAGVRVYVDSLPYTTRYVEILGADDTVDVYVDSVNFTNGGRTRHEWRSWSDGQARQHPVAGNDSRDTTITAQFARFHRLDVTVGAGGAVSTNPVVSSGDFIDHGTPVELTATPGADSVFVRWAGDTVAAAPVLTLPMERPYTVTATFAVAPTTANVVAHLLGPTTPLTTDQLTYLDNLGNKNGNFDVGDFLAWVKATGAP